MASENKWNIDKNHSIYWNPDMKKEGYREDKSDEIEDSPIKKLLIGAAAIGTGLVAYKSGALSKGIKKGLEYANEYKAVAPTVTRTFKTWLNNTSDDNISSLVRNKGIRDTLSKLSPSSIKNDRTIERTLDDFSDLKDMVKKNVSKKVKEHQINGIRLYMNTDLSNDISTIKRISKSYKTSAQRKEAYDIMSRDLVENSIQSKRKGEIQLKRTGYRTATLGDLIDVTNNKKGGLSLFAKNHDAPLDKDTMNKLNNFLSNTKAYDSKGNVIKDNNGNHLSLLSSGKYKKMALDKNIMIDEAGKIIDLRNVNKTGSAFVRSMANDFKIPFVGINPLKFFGLGRVGIRETKFGTLSMETAQPVITGKTGRVKLKESLEGLNKADMLVSNHKAYGFNAKTNKFEMVRDDIELRAINKDGSLSRELNDLSKMANIKKREYVDYTKKDGVIKNTMGKIGKKLDIGYQDSYGREFKEGTYNDILSSLDPGTWIEKGLKKVFDRRAFNKDYKKVENVFGTHSSIETANEMLYVALKQSIKFKEVFDVNNNITIQKYFAQFLSGRNNLKDVNPRALKGFYLIERMNQALSPFGLALSSESTGSAFSTAKNLILKRFLPLYAGYQAINYLDYLSEDSEGKTLRQKGATAIVDAEIGVHKVADAIGVTDLVKYLDELTPGSDQIEELPFIKQLKLNKSAEEVKDYYENGMDPVRKGRYWALGNSAFTGGKIDYYKPNWYRELNADAEFSDVKYGSRKEYFDNAWFPTITAPLAPVRHFITDKYHYEEKHYYDRPYLMTSPELEGVPLIGPTLSATVGQIIKPQKKMHKEYWETTNISNSEEDYNAYTVPFDSDNEGLKDKSIYDENVNEVYKIENNNVEFGNISTIKPFYNTEEMKTLEELKTITNSSITGIPKNTPEYDGKEYYTTSSGNGSVVNIDREKIDEINEELKERSLDTMIGMRGMPTGHNMTIEDIKKRSQESVEALNPNGILSSLSNQYRDTSNVTGIYGYIANAFVIGDLKPENKIIDTSGYAYSFNDKFWEQEFGGLGGDLSEIFRRFVQKKRTDVEYYNPIRNTMPDWMPGEEYFTDFKHGDPYQKVSKGELRLPGTPYERLWDIAPLDMSIKASNLSDNADDIKGTLFHTDILLNEDAINRDKEKKEDEDFKATILKSWSEDGIEFEEGADIDDKSNSIKNKYDVNIDNKILNIKPVNNETYNRIIEGENVESDIAEINHAMWSTGKKKGYLYYYNKETGESYSKAVKFDRELLDEQVQKVNEVREEINTAIDNREISRADLYSPIDKYRILADVAPYSQQFKDLGTILRQSNMDKETQKEYDAINARVSSQKEANRTYEYKFKTADVDTIDTEISRVDGNKIYVNLDGEERKVNLAGITEVKDVSLTHKIKSNLTEGKKIKLKVAEDEYKRDSTKGLKAVVYDNEGVNINKKLIDSGVAAEDENDWSAAGVHARFSAPERLFGSIWESVAHFDSYFNTKFLNVRSAVEDYERKEIYNKDFKSWDNPIEDYLMPTIYSAINRTGGVFVGGLVGSFAGKTKFGKVVGAIAGASTVLIGKTYKTGYEIINDKKWIPKVRRKEHELNEYMDTLNYVKNMKYYNYYKDKAMKEDNFNVDEYLKSKEEEKKDREVELENKKNTKTELQEIYDKKKLDYDEYLASKLEDEKEQKAKLREKQKKREKAFEDKHLGWLYDILKKKDIDTSESDIELERLKMEKMKAKENIQGINKEISSIENYREVEILPDNVIKALQYRDNAEKTMYGYDPGEPLTNIISALPKKDRERFKYFMKAPEKERERLLEIAPNYLKRPLQSVWGMEVDDKPSLEEYFQDHQLPGEDWVGWNEDVDLDDVKVKMINAEGLNNSEFNVWDSDVQKAKQAGKIPLPSVNFRANANEIRNKLSKLLSDKGLEDVNVSYSYGGSDANIDLDIEYDNQDKIDNKIRDTKFM